MAALGDEGPVLRVNLPVRVPFTGQEKGREREGGGERRGRDRGKERESRGRERG